MMAGPAQSASSAPYPAIDSSATSPSRLASTSFPQLPLRLAKEAKQLTGLHPCVLEGQMPLGRMHCGTSAQLF